VTRASAALFAALALTAANAAKPLVIDDPVYVACARQVLAHPLDPYGFDLYWGEHPEPAIDVGTLPPVLPYWLAGSMLVFGDHPVAWKLALLPFALALCGALSFLLARFAPALATPALFAIALGPALLPSLNLMLDVPALALGLLGFALGVRASEARATGLALLAGLALGLALQTKYSAVVYPGLLLAYALIERRAREPLLAVAVAALLFAGWELLIAVAYGRSHFLAGFEQVAALEILPSAKRLGAGGPGTVVAFWILSLVSLVGSTAAHAGVLALAGLGARLRSVAAAAAAIALAFAGVALLPRPPLFQAHAFFARLAAAYPELFLYVPLGLSTLLGVGWLAARALREPGARGGRVLAAWIALELLGYAVVAPFPAVRRVLGLGAALVALAAHAAARRGGAALAGARVAALLGVALGALFFGSELADARARRGLIERTAQDLASMGADPAQQTIWYFGFWEFQFYGERAGWRPLIADRTRLARGDWLVAPDGVAAPTPRLPAGAFRERDVLFAVSRSPWATIPHLYDGPVPLRRQDSNQSAVRIYRVLADVVPHSAR
jgi:hypothetical protein